MARGDAPWAVRRGTTAMTQAAKTQEPSMEEILASIRRIIADDDATKAPPKPPEPAKAAPAPAPARAAPPPPPAETNGQDAIDAMFAAVDAKPEQPAQPAPADIL